MVEPTPRDDGDGSDVPSVATETHTTSWSANLESEVHAENQVLVIDQAISAIKHTAPGSHVNLATHGHPEGFLYESLAREFGDTVECEFVDRYGCGGYVTRVHV